MISHGANELKQINISIELLLQVENHNWNVLVAWKQSPLQSILLSQSKFMSNKREARIVLPEKAH